MAAFQKNLCDYILTHRKPAIMSHNLYIDALTCHVTSFIIDAYFKQLWFQWITILPRIPSDIDLEVHKIMSLLPSGLILPLLTCYPLIPKLLTLDAKTLNVVEFFSYFISCLILFFQ